MNKRILALVLALSMLVLLAMPQAGLAADDKYVYVALGDSIPAGYGLSASQSYPAQLADRIQGGQLINLAQSGLTTSQLLAGLESDSAKATIASADLITLTIGANDIMGVVLNRVKQACGTDDWLAIAANPALVQKAALALENEDAAAEYEAAITGVAKNLPDILAKLDEINPKAPLIVTNVFNPYHKVILPAGEGGAIFDIGALTDLLIYGSKEHMGLNSAIEIPGLKVTDIASLFDAAAMTDTPYVNISLAKMQMDPHPNAAGQKAIADAIYARIAPALPITGHVIGVVKLKKDAKIAKHPGGPVIRVLPKGSLLIEYDSTVNYGHCKVGIGTGYGYIKDGLVTIVPLPTGRFTRSSLTQNVNVFTKASSSSKVLKKLYKYNQVLVLETSGSFSKVFIGGEKAAFGYVRTKYLKMQPPAPLA